MLNVIVMMELLDDIIYYSCGLVFFLHSVTAILIVTHGHCTVYAASFVIACAMWLVLTVLNLWFFLPTVIQAAGGMHLKLTQTGNPIVDALSIAIEVITSDAAWYLGLMLAGWFVGSMSLSNALTMWQREGCDMMDPHVHEGFAGRLVEWVWRAEEWVGIADVGEMAFFVGRDGLERREKGSWVFAVPRRLHGCYLGIVCQPVRLEEWSEEAGYLEEKP
ncbi:uncharacterized protein BCR38DRAFT_525940 [Pseudomassariella vexata]|uniref:Uncharacterized protein n=1 Tax=Pseudomassariella vexata TaxID=1141098 RepID=A0A1Y2DQJ8_9PEZI|nr:uncharacterized protein BCR38DRAFT_525940 [Pseudomassariella vexata]ORY61571.1 hypothetical protein BCR38DRAFT_525940 [Pseudomassariella vexata]